MAQTPATSSADTLSVSLRRRREAAGLSQAALAERAGLSRLTIALIEGKKRPHVAMSTVQALADAFGVGVDEMLQAPSIDPSPKPKRHREDSR